MNTEQPMYEWKDLNWRKLERTVFKLQKRIYKASERGDVKLVHRLQRLLVKSNAAKLLATRKVTQDNKGKNTPGIDGVKSIEPRDRLTLAQGLEMSYKARPTRRVLIPKSNGKTRPLGIPTLEDRAKQALMKLALEPEWEARFGENSFGFRPGRSAHDAIMNIKLNIKQGAKYVLDADISKCFDRINHEKLLEKLNTIPSFRRQIRAWLKAGFMEGKELFPTEEGTPQGGVISPLLANIALDGLEHFLMDEVAEIPFFYENGLRSSRRDKRKALGFTRYADDFVIIHKDLSTLMTLKSKTEKWLAEWGLELSPEKTRIVHTLNEHEGNKPGFEFLGFKIQQHRTGKYRSAKTGKGALLNFRTVIKPSDDSVRKHYQALCDIIKNCSGVTQEVLIGKLNPVIRGWCNYFSHVSSTETFNRIYHLLVWKLIKWGTKRHATKTESWCVNKYFRNVNGNNWTFACEVKGCIYKLVRHPEILIDRYFRVRGKSSPFDGNLAYWGERLRKYPGISTQKGYLLKRQKGKCNVCKLAFRDGDVMEVDHIIPKTLGGKDMYDNLQLLHKHCHHSKSSWDGSHDKGCTHDKGCST